ERVDEGPQGREASCRLVPASAFVHRADLVVGEWPRGHGDLLSMMSVEKPDISHDRSDRGPLPGPYVPKRPSRRRAFGPRITPRDQGPPIGAAKMPAHLRRLSATIGSHDPTDPGSCGRQG